MNTQEVRGLPVISLVDGTHVGTIDQVYLDLVAKRVAGFSITNGIGPFGGTRDSAPTVAASKVHSLGADALTLDDVTAAHAAWVDGQFGTLVSLDDLAGRQVMTESGTNIGNVASVGFDEHTFALTEVEVSPGFLKTHTLISLAQLVRIGQDVVVVADATVAADEPAVVAG